VTVNEFGEELDSGLDPLDGNRRKAQAETVARRLFRQEM
jgi:hypothetical protein